VTTGLGIPSGNASRVDRMLDEVRLHALAVGRAFAAVHPLVARSEMMSLNARIAAMKLGPEGAPFTVVAAAINELGEALDLLVDDVEDARAGVVRHVAHFTANEKRLALYRRCLDADRAGGGARPLGEFSTTTALSAEAELTWRSERDRGAEDALSTKVLDALLDERTEMLHSLTEMRRVTRRLGAIVNKVRSLAEVHGFFIGMNALIECSRLSSDDTGLSALANSLYSLTRDVALVVREANAEASRLVKLSERTSRAMSAANPGNIAKGATTPAEKAKREAVA